MIKKISRKAFLKRYPDFIQDGRYKKNQIFPETFDAYILSVEAKSTVGLCNSVSKELTEMVKRLGYETLYFLGDTVTPWLFRDHDYPPVKKALDYLVNHKISKTFNGAIQVDLEDLPEFMKNLFWLVRCNGIVIYAHFSDHDFNIIGSICKYGNIHFSTLNETSDDIFNQVLDQTKLEIFEGESCGGGRIPGRTSTYIPTD